MLQRTGRFWSRIY